MQNLKELFVEYNIAKKRVRVLDNKFIQEIITHLSEVRHASVTEIYVKIKRDQSVASSFLKSLKKLKLVNVEKHGKQRLYSLNVERLQALTDSIKSFNEL